jgi:hypothetical protein
MGGVCSTCGENRNAYKILVGKLEGRRQVVGTWFGMGEK